MALSCNVGGADKNIRIILGLVLIAVGLFAGLGPRHNLDNCRLRGCRDRVTHCVRRLLPNQCAAWRQHV